MNIRKVVKSDNSGLARMIRKVFEEYDAPKLGTVYSDPTTDHLFELFQKEKSVLWVMESEDQRLLGCCGIYPTEGLPENCAEMVKLYIASEARGKGFGRKLMDLNIKSAMEMGYSQLYIESLPQFSTAVNMYERSGFTRLNNALGLSGHSTCDIWMIKTIGDKGSIKT